MKRYFIDTCVLKWLLEGSKRVKDINYDLDYFQGNYAISIEVLTEFVNLIVSGKIKYDIDYDRLVKYLSDSNIEICYFEKKHLKQLFSLPYFSEHKDQTDRKIIAQAITDKRTLISGDEKFPLYENAGLKFLQI
jgi:PIN domain nuclease of toxin-antitoxin system